MTPPSHGTHAVPDLTPTQKYIIPDSRPTLRLISVDFAACQPSSHDSAICSLRFTMALAGSKPFGQQLVQFMMPWQQYNFMVSFTQARRSSVNWSRESAIHL